MRKKRMLDGAVPERRASMRPIDADALMDEANSDGAYGYVDAKQISDAPTVDAVPIEELEHLRNELYEHDLITMEGLKRLNTLIRKYTTTHNGGANNG